MAATLSRQLLQHTPNLTTSINHLNPNLSLTLPTSEQATLAVMKSHPNNRVVVIQAFKGLHNLALHASNIAVMKSLDAIVIVRTVKLYYPRDGGVQEEADKLLVRLTSFW